MWSAGPPYSLLARRTRLVSQRNGDPKALTIGQDIVRVDVILSKCIHAATAACEVAAAAKRAGQGSCAYAELHRRGKGNPMSETR